MRHLPVEIITMILKNLRDKYDLFSVRLVCKQWADVTATLIFRRITLWQLENGCLQFPNFAPRLAAFDHSTQVRHLTYKFMNCANEDVTSPTLIRCMKKRENEQNPMAASLRALFQIERDHPLSHGDLSLEAALLITTFSELPNLKSLHIIEDDHFWSTREESLSSQGEEMEDDDPLSTFTRGHQVLYKLFVCLSESETKIESLTITSSASFVSLLPNLVPWLHCFGAHSRPTDGLRRLQLESPRDFSDVSVAKFISSLPMLDGLCFTSQGHVEGSYWPLLTAEFLTELRVSRLKSIKFAKLCLENANSLSEFLTIHLTTLRNITIREVWIGTDSGDSVFIQEIGRGSISIQERHYGR